MRHIPRRLGRRLGRDLRRGFGRGMRGPRVQGIRFRLGLAMALALAPFLILSGVQTQNDFRDQANARRLNVLWAAQRGAQEAETRLNGTAALLQAVRFEKDSPQCGARLQALLGHMEGYTTLARVNAMGQVTCSGGEIQGLPVTDRPWFQRLRAGEDWVISRARRDFPALVAGLRLEDRAGGFDGALSVVIPLTTLQPDLTDPSLPPGTEAALVGPGGEILLATAPEVFEGGDSFQRWLQTVEAHAGQVREMRDSRGERRAYAAALLAGQDVHVVLAAPSPGPLSWARLNPIGAFFLPVAAWLAAFCAVLLASERIVIRWLDYLERIAALYTRGRFSVRPVQAVNAPTEIRNLAGTLDSLAETISSRDRTLLDNLAEKDALMREIHHRVKNNLQIISSMLSLQQRTVDDAPARAALGDTRQRIAALALIFRTLYQGEDIRLADAGTFLNELVGQLVAGEAVNGLAVDSRVEADSLIVDPEKLAPMALWLVEAVSNALKHALPARGGRLTVRFRVEGDTSTLEVEDDGPGLAETASVGVGRTLMDAFSRQLRGRTEILSVKPRGTRVRMTFATPTP